jgi:hypothetical protein
VSQEPAGSTHPSEDDDDLFELPFSVSSRMNESRHYSASVMGEKRAPRAVSVEASSGCFGETYSGQALKETK